MHDGCSLSLDERRCQGRDDARIEDAACKGKLVELAEDAAVRGGRAGFSHGRRCAGEGERRSQQRRRGFAGASSCAWLGGVSDRNGIMDAAGVAWERSDRILPTKASQPPPSVLSP